jgi:hypothetical protein
MKHKIIDFPKYNDMQNMFKNKGMDYIKTICGGAKGCQSFTPYGGCQYGHH